MRSLTENDRPYVIDLFDHLSSKSRYYRYYQYLNDLPESLLDKIIHANKENDFAMGAFLETPVTSQSTLIGIARYVEENAPGEAEFSISVRDDFHHEGVGSNLMRSMLQVAKENSYQNVHGYVMSDNHEMLTLMSHLGAKCQRDPEDATMMIVTFILKK
jgi:acetyltransferase